MHGASLFSDLRERVVAFVTSGQTTRAASAAFDVSVASVVKWTQRVRASGSAAAKPMGGKRPFLWKRSAIGYWRGSMKSPI